MDEEGILPEALAAAAGSGAPRSWSLSPNLHNPTAILMPGAAARRHRRGGAASSTCCWSRTMSTARWSPTGRRRWLTLAPGAHALSRPACRSSWRPVCAWASSLGPRRLVREVAAAQRELSLGLPPLAASCSPARLRAGVVAEALRQQRLEMSERQQLARDAAGRPRAAHAADRAACLAAPAGALEQRRGGAGAGADRRAGDARRSGSSSAAARCPRGAADLALGAADPRPSARRAGADRRRAGARSAAVPRSAAWSSGSRPPVAAEKVERHSLGPGGGRWPGLRRRHGTGRPPARRDAVADQILRRHADPQQGELPGVDEQTAPVGRAGNQAVDRDQPGAVRRESSDLAPQSPPLRPRDGYAPSDRAHRRRRESAGRHEARDRARPDRPARAGQYATLRARASPRRAPGPARPPAPNPAPPVR